MLKRKIPENAIHQLAIDLAMKQTKSIGSTSYKRIFDDFTKAYSAKTKNF